jgi:hypothetical protein
MNLNNISMWATVVSGYLFVIITLAAGFKIWFKHNMRETLNELKPNGGSSIKDSITRIEITLAKLEGKFEQHIKEHE